MDSKHKTKAKAEARAKRLRADGYDATVRRDPFSGQWIVDIIFLGLALNLLGASFKR